ncbi:MAG: RsmG family class I SAM-dependent methyltransferase [Acidimicrobiia bacterium]
MDNDVLKAAAGWAGFQLSPAMVAGLRQLEDWLSTEGVALGGLGPNEIPNLTARHIGDSITFARGWAPHSVAPAEIMDLGSGTGLPALPLAICHPDTMVRAIDRSARRCRLIRRAARVIGLENIEVEEADITRLDRTAPVVVSRAAMPPELLLPHLQRVTEPGGVAVVGGSHRTSPEVVGFKTVEIPSEILDHSAWLLMMATP